MKSVIQFIAAVTLASTAAVAADSVPLKTDLPFDKAAAVREEPITLVVSNELAHETISKKMRFARFEFPLGNSAASNTEQALRSAFEKVRLARSAEDADTNLQLELTALEVTPKFPATTFGTFTSKVKLTYVFRDQENGIEKEIVVNGDGGNKKHAGMVLWDAGWKNTEAQQFGRATDIAMLDALEQLLAQLP